MRRHAAIPWILPFLVFVALLALQYIIPVPVWLRFALPMAVIVAVSRRPLQGSPARPLMSVVVGIAVFLLWILPDRLAPGWHHAIIFDNPVTGHPLATTADFARHDPVYLAFRVAVSVVAVPILEELFWRGWLMRWIIASKDFEQIPLGAFTYSAFWVTAFLFGSEHGSFWDVGIAAGVVYNWWMIRTRNIWDCIIAHAVTNGVLAAYVIGAGQWQYWL